MDNGMDAKQQIRRATTEIRGERPVVSRGRRAQWCNLSLVWGAGLSVAIGPERRREGHTVCERRHINHGRSFFGNRLPFLIWQCATFEVRDELRTSSQLRVCHV